MSRNNPKSKHGRMETVNVELESYDLDSQKWRKETSILHHAVDPFSSGGMRHAYRAWNCKVRNWEGHPMVLKMPITGDLQTERLVRQQVVMQAQCARYAEQFNIQPAISKKVSMEC